MGFNFSFSLGSNRLGAVERDRFGNWFYELIGGNYNRTLKIQDKVKFVAESPAVYRAVNYNCETAIQGNINLYNKDGKKISDNYLYQLALKPNPNQSWTELLAEYAFFKQLYEVAYLYQKNGVIYFLNNSECTFTEKTRNEFSTIDFSKVSVNNRFKGTFKYRTQTLDLSNLIVIGNYRGASGNWFNSFSKIDALFHVINGTNETIFANNEWLIKAQTFLATGEEDGADMSQTRTSPGMTRGEKDSIQSKLNRKGTHATQSKITTSPLVSNLGVQRFDEGFSAKHLFICAMLGISKDLAEYLRGGATFENMEKSFGRHIDYTIKPMFQPLLDALELLYETGDNEFRMEFDHLPFNAVFAKDQSDKRLIDIQALEKSLAIGGLSEKEIQDLNRKLWGLN